MARGAAGGEGSLTKQLAASRREVKRLRAENADLKLLLVELQRALDGAQADVARFRALYDANCPNRPERVPSAEQARRTRGSPSVARRHARARRASRFCRTLNGARVGDIYTSLIVSTVLHRGDPIRYLTSLFENDNAVAAAPADWLPWNYERASLEPAQTAAA